MNLANEFHPVPKPIKERKEKPKPAFKEKRFNRQRKKKKKVEMYKGIKIPHKKKRGEISKTDYEKALLHYGGGCAETGNIQIEMHHIVFRSQGGRGGWRNLVPLSKEFHTKCHTDREYAEYWRREHEKKFGPHFMKDRFDLWKEGLIHNPTEEAFEKFMEGEEERAKAMGS
ncbi:HNH endonuclease [Fictibacillus gelatini]|uniref:HNH endonuclease signature motif containing protein n=1 Tax=Fictibacillus gelatini TaxID=225985 RepID=UPI00042191EB|nr:HNH endonuclease [Fictibacillus gelatini]